MTFLLHNTHELRVGLCHEDDGAQLPEDAIIARLSFDQVIGLFDDISETFESCAARGVVFHPEEGDEE